ncbi:NAD(P)-binding Rossmann-like domain-containing protein [Pedococcus cremeus]|uniref:NAD(P)-binding Rossmann-like domain-containing protein n=2 Tax=Pedococcus cremeus TaxID=587636 RepID=A0A1H9V2E4_9MICO|nr:NAD(P)-binding Rossmann-like domain-containing protein [Pedococcus cremeus]
MAGLTTAWELSSGDCREQLDSITVYQRGWRLGGKGASSRGPHGRVEEHGLHVLLGCYDATFRVLREVYAELDRAVTDPACPLPGWRDAFVPAGAVGLADRHDGAWSHFVTQFSSNDALPGEPGAEDRRLTPVDVASRTVGLLMDFHRAVSAPGPPAEVYLSASPTPRPARSDLGALLRGTGLTGFAVALQGLTRAEQLASGAGPDEEVTRRLAALLGAWRDGIRGVVLADPALRRTWQLVDLVVTSLQGMVVDGLLTANSYDAIDHLDYGEWLARHGAAPETLDSPIVRGMHDLTFAYAGADRTRPGFSAGLGLHLAGRMLFDFKGSIFWRMQVGMGEAVFAPLYEALVRRGVDFRFFRRLDHLGLAPGGSLGTVELTRQADLAAGRARYDPLVRLDDLPCWPHRPLVEQLADDPGDQLESHWWPGAGTGRETLVAGEDFDVAVLAVSVGMVPHVASELVRASPRWRRMVERVGTVATQSAQLWLDASESDLGWSGPPTVTLTGFGDTFETWAAMSHLLPRESWPTSGGPRSIAYLCGAMPDVDPGSADEVVRHRLTRFLETEVGSLWPKANGRNGFRWNLLWDDEGRCGPDRLAAQYLRANVDPSDRYVQSLPGTGRFRLAPGDTGFDNLVVAGDWTACGFDAGCLEAATRSGVLAARAVMAAGAGARPEEQSA